MGEPSLEHVLDDRHLDLPRARMGGLVSVRRLLAARVERVDGEGWVALERRDVRASTGQDAG